MRALWIATLSLAGSASARAESITTTTTTTTTTTVTLDEPALQPPGETPPIETQPIATPTFRLGAAVGPALGFDTKDDCSKFECVGVHVQLATAIAPHLLATIGSSIMTVPGDDKGLHNGVHHVETIGLQWWATRRLWAEAGLGAGSKRSWSYENDHGVDVMSADSWAPAGTLAVGYSAWRVGPYGVGVEARLASTDDVHHTAFAQLLAGFDWF